MIAPYKMAFLNTMTIILLFSGWLFYMFIFPKRKFNLFILLLLISILPLISILRIGVYESGDFNIHVKIAMQFYENLKQGNIIPAWIEKSCSGYGCPSFIFIYTLPYYLISFFHFLGLSFIASTKVLLAISYILSGIGMYMWIKDEFGEISAFVSAIFYLFSPYHLIDLHFRVSIAEILSLTILPFLFLYTKRLVDNRSPYPFFFISFLFAALIITHQVTSSVSLPLLILYGFIVWLRKPKRNVYLLLLLFLSYICGIFLTAYYWLPVFFEGKYTLWGTMGGLSFTPFKDFIYSSNRLGFLFQGHKGEIYPIIGYTQWFIVLSGIFILFRKKIKTNMRIILKASLILFIILFLMMQSFSKPIWDAIPIIKNFQFSYRLSIEIILLISVIAAIVVKVYKNKIFIFILCFVTITYTLLNWGNRGMIPQINDTILQNQLILTERPGMVDTLNPIWVDYHKPWMGIVPKKHVEILSGNAKIIEISHSIIHHEYLVSVKEIATFKENTNFFPGWKLYVNNKELNINYKNKNYPGIITFNLDRGIYKVALFFADTIDRIVGKWISLLTFLLIGIYFIYLISIKYFLFRFTPKRKV